ncbi:uncharacterized protein BO96DRAFT_400616 [Aspergillus niger CBS 101883]|uniref:Contig An04c0040, genomic contig n=2 Tax=Aspergillus niger TaxID=5061 RepID=A2QHR9_ASPNC|nr:uncharacterized protein BO96DRAFT_400616 [Aspergillus niger CBS 101883]XP_059600453.1 uncharacterized protein An04g00820 [Aspergillus niger]PYH53103.1 hypothetical protein BO96DRAFT_400616 [Aspergillus niger CBS 101883]CAK38539.1 unnamed protein product [Aspergillus niger]
MQTPSQVAALDLEPAEDTASKDGVQKGHSLQKIVRFDLKEEGNHILAVSVSYTETLIGSDAQAASGRVRTFRKLYQFVAQPCLSVRTKSSELAPLEVENKTLGPYGKTRLLRFALEAQLENPKCRHLLGDMLILTANEAQSETAIQGRISQLGSTRTGSSGSAATDSTSAGCLAGRIPCRARRRPTGRAGDPAEGHETRRTRSAGPAVDRVERRDGRQRIPNDGLKTHKLTGDFPQPITDSTEACISAEDEWMRREPSGCCTDANLLRAANPNPLAYDTLRGGYTRLNGDKESDETSYQRHIICSGAYLVLV